MTPRAIVMLIASLLGLVAFLPVFALSTLVVFGDASAGVGNAILGADLVAPLLGLAGALLARRAHTLSFYAGVAGGGLGLAAAAAILLVTYPWDTVIAVRNLLLLHTWAAFLVAATVWPHPHGASPGVTSG